MATLVPYSLAVSYSNIQRPLAVYNASIATVYRLAMIYMSRSYILTNRP